MKMPKTERIYHCWGRWECTSAGMYDPVVACDEAKNKQLYREFLSCSIKFQRGIDRVFKEWPISCENFLTNQSINRIAWIGQSAACIELGLCAGYKGGFWLLSQERQAEANLLALNNLISWVAIHNANKTASRRVRNGVGTQMLFQWDSRRSAESHRQ